MKRECKRRKFRGRKYYLLSVPVLILALLSAPVSYAKGTGGAGDLTPPASGVSVYAHAMETGGTDVLSYMVEAEEQMCPLTSLQVTFADGREHSIWGVRENGEQIAPAILAAGTHIISLPADIKEVGLTVYAGEEETLDLCIPGAKPKVSPYTGCYLSILGDSLSSVELAGSLQTDSEGLNVATKWWYIAAEEMGMNILVDGAVGSTGVGVDVPEGAGNSGLHKCTDIHTGAHAPDCIFILLGVNDLLAGKDVGQVESEYRQMIALTEATYPQADILLFTYPYIGDGEGGEMNRMVERYVPQMNDVIRRVAADYGLDVVDLYGCGITAENAGKYVRKPGDIHPNRDGQALMGKAAIEGLRQIAGRDDPARSGTDLKNK